ncbi:MAG: hypothetical protein JSV69_08710 [Chloroflexota bacterium]|nr:MAG: hypothetical protein JSV69_08710 [Chloroflexota bacterium]
MGKPSLYTRYGMKREDLKRDWRLYRINRQIANNARPKPDNPTVGFFIASARLSGISLNAAYAYLTACGLQVAGIPVAYFACNAGMSRCVLGTSWQDPSQLPPCAACVSRSRRLYAHAPTVDFSYDEDRLLRELIGKLNVQELSGFTHPSIEKMGDVGDLPLGEIVLPSLRWATRQHTLEDDEQTRFLFREFILSAWQVAVEFSNFLEQVDPRTMVVFNGVLFPEAIVRWLAQKRGLRVVTHEVGFKPFSAFFTDQHATSYPVNIPEDFQLASEQNEALDDYLGQRFQGKFTMAGIKFWPEMRQMDDELIEKVEGFKQIVPVFTNVIFDTSQIHSNTVFTTMFSWLDLVKELIKSHPETLFVIRAHPDEMRSGKQSRESVPDWVARNEVDRIPNVVFINPREYLSSYELIQRSKFVMVYNSSIGLEAVLMGKAVLCGGRARYTQYDIVYFPETPKDYRRQAERFLSAKGSLEIPEVKLRNARKFMYFQQFKASIPFNDFLEDHTQPGYVRLKPFSWRQLKAENSPTMQVLIDGIIHEKPFLLSESNSNG